MEKDIQRERLKDTYTCRYYAISANKTLVHRKNLWVEHSININILMFRGAAVCTFEVNEVKCKDVLSLGIKCLNSVVFLW